MAKLSVIIPFHQGKSYLLDCLTSIREQFFDGLETILVLDRLREDISELLEEFSDILKGHVFYLEKELGKSKSAEDYFGVAVARNFGLTKATGEYVYFLDSDDYLVSGELDGRELEHMYEQASSSKADYVYAKKTYTWFSRATFLSGVAAHKSNLQYNLDIEDAEIRKAYFSPSFVSEYHQEMENEKQGKWVSPVIVAYDLIRNVLGIQRVSILNIMIRKGLLEKLPGFDESGMLCVDAAVVAALVSGTKRVFKNESVCYVKRFHNDPIRLPSLEQMLKKVPFADDYKAYIQALKVSAGDDYMHHQIELSLLNYYTNYFAVQMREGKEPEWNGQWFDMFQKLLAGCSFSEKDFNTKKQKKFYELLLQGNKKRIISKITKVILWPRIKKLRHNRLELKKYVYFHHYTKKPIKKNTILFESFFGKNYSDSPRAVSDYINEHYPGQYELVWVLNEKSSKVPYAHKKVRRFTFRYFYYLAVSKYFVFNGRQPLWMRKKKEQVFLETWHGTPLKKLVFDMDDVTSATPLYKQNVYQQSRDWDYLISPNEFCSEVFSSCFLYDQKKMLETGYPRNDVLHTKDREQKALQIRQKIGIPADKKTILYAPTWRDDQYYEAGQYKFELMLDLQKMKKALGEEYVVLLRTHYFIADSIDTTGFEGFAFNLSKYDDIADIYLISDILITDYSSVFFDYANLKRPMLFFTYDLEKYRDMLRGFYISIEHEVPGPLVFNTEQIIDRIQHIEQMNQEYAKKYDAFYQRFCGWEDGNASKRVTEALLGRTD